MHMVLVVLQFWLVIKQFLENLTHWSRKVNSTTFRRRHFQTYLLQWKYLNFNQNFIEFVNVGPIINIPALVHITADLATGPYLNQWWSDYRRIYALLGLNESSDGFFHVLRLFYCHKCMPMIPPVSMISIWRMINLITILYCGLFI